MNPDVIVVGGGHNGLVTAARLARRGVKTLVLERRPVAGGAAITGEFHPGFRVSTLAHAAQPASGLVSDLRLADYGLQFVNAHTPLFAPLPDTRGLVIGRGVEADAASIGAFSRVDARRYPEFTAVVGRIATFLSQLMASAPPDIEQPGSAELFSALSIARQLRTLGTKDAYRLLRWAPMSVADFVSEWFESEPLRSAVAAPALIGTALGPRSAGGTAVWLIRRSVSEGAPRLVRGGLGALTTALVSVARTAGAEIRVNAGVRQIDVQNGAVAGVTLESGEQLSARAVVSNADPRRTFLSLIDPVHLEPGFLTRIRAYRANGNVLKVNLALSGLPLFKAADHDESALSGFIQIAPTLDYIERAFDASKYGACSARPHLEITIPSLTDPTLAPSGAHVMSIVAQFAPYRLRQGNWSAARGEFADRVIDTLAEYAPGIRQLILHREVITPADLESEYGLTGGHIFHGELSLDQLFTMRPLLGWARYRTPIRGLYLCGAGTHPGYGVSGLSGLNASRQILSDLR